MEIARNAHAATDDHDLNYEIGLLCKGTIIDSSNVHRLTVEDLAERRRQVAALVRSTGRPKGRGRRRPKSKQRQLQNLPPKHPRL